MLLIRAESVSKRMFMIKSLNELVSFLFPKMFHEGNSAQQIRRTCLQSESQCLGKVWRVLDRFTSEPNSAFYIHDGKFKTGTTLANDNTAFHVFIHACLYNLKRYLIFKINMFGLILRDNFKNIFLKNMSPLFSILTATFFHWDFGTR